MTWRNFSPPTKRLHVATDQQIGPVPPSIVQWSIHLQIATWTTGPILDRLQCQKILVWTPKIKHCANIIFHRNALYDGRQHVPAVSTGKALLSCLQVYPRTWFISSEIMWSLYSIAMLLSNELRCFGVVYCPFQCGIISLFCMPRVKKPPDPFWTGELTLVEEIID